MNDDPLKKYPVWSNFVYFFVGLYAWIIAVSHKKEKLDAFAFIAFGLLIIGAGISSVVYHLKTPSWTGDPETKNDQEYKISMKCDMAFSISTIIYAFLWLFLRIGVYYRANKYNGICNFPMFADSNWWLAVFFVCLAIIFYWVAYDHNHTANDKCKDDKSCVDKNLDGYDVFHSNWHIFAAVGGFFVVNVLHDSYSWK